MFGPRCTGHEPTGVPAECLGRLWLAGTIGDHLEGSDHPVDGTKQANHRADRADQGHVAESMLKPHVLLFTNFLHLGSGGEVYFCPDLKEIKDYYRQVVVHT